VRSRQADTGDIEEMMEPDVTPYARNSKLAAYQTVSVHGGVANADPHQMVQMLMDAASERMAKARGCMGRGEKGRHAGLLHSTVMIIGELRGSLNITEGGPLAQNLSDLYDYMIRQLVLANARTDSGLVLEVSRLLDEIRSAWIAIGPEVRKSSAPVPKAVPATVAAGPA
jgi:flagellar protein FliS